MSALPTHAECTAYGRKQITPLRITEENGQWVVEFLADEIQYVRDTRPTQDDVNRAWSHWRNPNMHAKYEP